MACEELYSRQTDNSCNLFPWLRSGTYFSFLFLNYINNIWSFILLSCVPLYPIYICWALFFFPVSHCILYIYICWALFFFPVSHCILYIYAELYSSFLYPTVSYIYMLIDNVLLYRPGVEHILQPDRFLTDLSDVEALEGVDSKSLSATKYCKCMLLSEKINICKCSNHSTLWWYT